jgi:hypothetical protein
MKFNIRSVFLPMVVIILIIGGIRKAPTQYYAEDKAWFIDNWKDPVLSWEIYRDSFIGIPPTYDPWSSAFDVLFYDQLYKSKLSESGNCFGMSLMSLMMLQKGGYLGFCLPVPQYSGDLYSDLGPTDPDLRHAINQMHGHQVSLPALKFMLDLIARGKNRDGNFAYDQFNYYKMKNDLTVISVTKSTSPADGGHTMVAYDAKIVDGYKRIFLYDPNRSWADPVKRTWYTSGKNYITIDSTGTNGWTYDHGDGYWSGKPASGGNIMILPISVIGPTARSPASLGLNISDILATFFITGDGAEITQITDQDGKRLYIPGTTEVDTNPATGMLNTLPWISSDQKRTASGNNNAGKVLAYFMLGNPTGSLDIDIRSGKEGYKMGMFGRGSYLSVRADQGSGADLITLENAGSQQPGVIIRNQSNAAKFDVEFIQILDPYKKSRHFRLNNLEVPALQPMLIRVTDNQKALELQTTDARIQYDLELVNVVRSKPEILKQEKLKLDAGKNQIIKPGNWRILKKEDLKIKQNVQTLPQDKLRRIPQRQK